VRLAGHLYHTSAIGELVTSLYAAGQAQYRSGVGDPSPGVASITAVVPRLKLKNLDQVVEVNTAENWVMAQGRCRLSALRAYLIAQGLALAPGRLGGNPDKRPNSSPAQGGEAENGRAGIGAVGTVGAGVIGGEVEAVWVDMLTQSGLVTRHAQAELPPDALIVAAALRLAR
jgi:hypothetical protein